MRNLAEQVRLNRYRERRDTAVRELRHLEAGHPKSETAQGTAEIANLKRLIGQLDRLIAELEGKKA